MKTKLLGLFGLLLFAVQIQVMAGSGPAAPVSEKLLKAFKASFPEAETVDWKESGDYYFVHFKEHGYVSEIEYDHDGNFIESEKYYSNIDMLPQHLAWELRNKFRGKTVFGITEVNTESETSYYVKMQDNKEWVTVKGTAYGIEEVVEKFNKQL